LATAIDPLFEQRLILAQFPIPMHAQQAQCIVNSFLQEIAVIHIEIVLAGDLPFDHG
jgi:hypothetical protein